MSKFDKNFEEFVEYDLDKRHGRSSIKSGISYMFANLGKDEEKIKKAIRAGQVAALYKECIDAVYGDSAFLILEKTNAVYILHEPDKGDLKVARPTDKLIWRLLIYTCDSMVHADLDARQETIKREFIRRGQEIDTFELFSSKLNMRKRFPFKETAKNQRADLANAKQRKNKEKMTDLQRKTTLEVVQKIENENLRKSLQNLIENN